MGIPDTEDMAGEEFHCDECRAKDGLPVNSFPLPRRDRRAEMAAAVTAARARKSATSKPRKGGRNRPMSQRQREALEDAETAPVRSRADIEKAQAAAKVKAARKAADKAAGLSKQQSRQQRAAVRAKERAARKLERAVKKAAADKAATAGGLKSLLASFDESSDESSDTDSTDDSSDSSSDNDVTPIKPISTKASTTNNGGTNTTTVTPTPLPIKSASGPTKSVIQPSSTHPKSNGNKATLQSMGWEAVRTKVRNIYIYRHTDIFFLSAIYVHSPFQCSELQFLSLATAVGASFCLIWPRSLFTLESTTGFIYCGDIVSMHCHRSAPLPPYGWVPVRLEKYFVSQAITRMHACMCI
jgi:hypothetical protein